MNDFPGFNDVIRLAPLKGQTDATKIGETLFRVRIRVPIRYVSVLTVTDKGQALKAGQSKLHCSDQLGESL